MYPAGFGGGADSARSVLASQRGALNRTLRSRARQIRSGLTRTPSPAQTPRVCSTDHLSRKSGTVATAVIATATGFMLARSGTGDERQRARGKADGAVLSCASTRSDAWHRRREVRSGCTGGASSRSLRRCRFAGISSGCLASYDEWDEDLADAVALEVDVDGDPRAGLIEGCTVTSTWARIGPSTPRTAQVVGGSSLVTIDVEGRSAPPMRRTIWQCEPTAAGPGSFRPPETTPSCHSWN